MRSLLRAFPVLVLLVAAIETFLVRTELSFRPTDARLFLEAVVLWAGLGLLALIPAAITCLIFARKNEEGRGAWPPAVLLGWMVLPLVAHPVIDRHTHTGDLRVLQTAQPWLEVGGVLVFMILVVALLSRIGRKLPQPLFGMALVVASIAVGMFLPYRTTPVMQAAASSDKPNLLFLVWDTCRSDRLGSYGHERPTSPFLDQLADESIVFEDSTSVAIFTFSSHLTMLTGVYPSTHGARMLSMRYNPQRATMLAETLRKEGYRTGGFVGTDVIAGRTGMRYGFEVYDDVVDPMVCDTRAWQLIHDLQVVLARVYPSMRNNGRPHWIQDFQRPAEGVLDNALAWIRNDDPRPWFCFVNLYDVHWPYLPDEKSRQELVDTEEDNLDGFLFRADDWVKGSPISEADKAHVNQLYEAEIRELDETVADFLAALNLDRGGTAVLVTADHGEAFGEGGAWKHEDIGEPQVRVPFLVRLPEEKPAPERRRGQVSGVDVTPTLLGLAGIEIPEGVEGIDVLSDSPEERLVFVEDRDHASPYDIRIALYRHPYKLVRTGLSEQATYALYNVVADPLAETDIKEREPAVFRELKGHLEERRSRFDAEEAQIKITEGSSEQDALEALGYTEN